MQATPQIIFSSGSELEMASPVRAASNTLETFHILCATAVTNAELTVLSVNIFRAFCIKIRTRA